MTYRMEARPDETDSTTTARQMFGGAAPQVYHQQVADKRAQLQALGLRPPALEAFVALWQSGAISNARADVIIRYAKKSGCPRAYLASCLKNEFPDWKKAI